MSELAEGTYIVLFLDGVELANQDSFTLNSETEEIELAADSEGYADFTPDKISYMINVTGITAKTPDKTLFNALNNRTVLNAAVKFEQDVNNSQMTYTCFCKTFQKTSEVKGYSTFSASFRVKGKINW